MQVFKFGGASVANHEKIKNVAGILGHFKGEKIMVIISAMGKTTNALEKVANAFFEGKKEEALELFRAVKLQHLDEAKFLLVTHFNALMEQYNAFFTEAEWLLHEKPVRHFDYYYDQIVCIGEMLSTSLVSAYLNEIGLSNQWLDVRDIIRTDNNFRDAGIDFNYSQRQCDSIVKPLFQTHDIVITQGFVGATDENESTTLGREGSDYSAAVFASLLDAESLSIWKDVKGVPLYVKCFADASLPGTVIHNAPVKDLPPIIVVKQNQALIELHTKDFSFIGEQPMSDLYEMMAKLKIKPNLIQTHAVSLQLCLDDRADKIEKLALAAAGQFDVTVHKGLSLLSIRHYTNELILKMTEGKTIEIRQQSPIMIQVLMR